MYRAAEKNKQSKKLTINTFNDNLTRNKIVFLVLFKLENFFRFEIHDTFNSIAFAKEDFFLRSILLGLFT